MAVLTHFQPMSYDIFSLLYVLIFRCCILLLGTVYIGSELIEISEPINVMKICLASFLLIFSNWCVGWLWFCDWRHDWNQKYVSDILNIFVEYTEKFSEAFENNKWVSAETKKLCQNFPTSSFIAFLFIISSASTFLIIESDNQIGMSCSRDWFTTAKNCVRWILQTPWTCS